MKTINSYKDLIIWQKSISLVKEIYKLTSLFPQNEQFGIVAQLRRASVSIPSNIAEGYGRRTIKERQQFNLMAYGSALEIETQLLISKELKFAQANQFLLSENILLEVIKMLNKITSQARQR